ncbi:membrane-bound ClpP family serine protease [Bacillus niacini]|uniref:Membrane-bound ClpP family serine protease n=1 Tax=Neobacillus niacini TaxID=86668 RepID=A0A852TMS3_9BACI|nr:hypothetical protein [Neobacillus niacini]NYE09699.1 membrane-bound ClpP family serine protease [Neobacillus niacini]
MKLFSIWSIILVFLGLISFGLNWLIEGYFEPIVLIGVIFFLIGVIFSFIAISKKEKGSIKFISLASFFIILFLVSWFEPFQVVRIMTWLKNIA